MRAPTVSRIPFGNAGVRCTVGTMWQLILDYSPAVRRTAERILREYKVPFASNTLQAAALYDWVQQHLAYVGDHVLMEEVRGPEQLLTDIAAGGYAMEDCDGFTTLLGALFASIGLAFNLGYVSTRDDGEFNHVFLIVETANGTIVTDAIGRDAQGRPVKFGWHVPEASITNYEESAMPASYEAMGVTPRGVPTSYY